jgi:hypothetical protein
MFHEVGRLVGWLVGWLVGRSVGRSVTACHVGNSITSVFCVVATLSLEI